MILNFFLAYDFHNYCVTLAIASRYLHFMKTRRALKIIQNFRRVTVNRTYKLIIPGAATVRIAIPTNMQSNLIFHYNLKFYESEGDTYDGVSLKRFVMQVRYYTAAYTQIMLLIGDSAIAKEFLHLLVYLLHLFALVNKNTLRNSRVHNAHDTKFNYILVFVCVLSPFWETSCRSACTRQTVAHSCWTYSPTRWRPKSIWPASRWSLRACASLKSSAKSCKQSWFRCRTARAANGVPRKPHGCSVSYRYHIR